MFKKRTYAYVFITLLFCTIVTVGFSQTKKDSLWNDWSNKDLQLTERLDALNEYTTSFILFSIPDSARGFAKVGLREARNNNLQIQEGDALHLIGLTYHITGKADSAIVFYQESIAVKSITNDLEGLSSTYSNLGVIYTNQNNYLLAEEVLNEALLIAITTEDLSSEASALFNIGRIYSFKNNFDQAIEYYNKSLKIRLAQREIEKAGRVYNNLGSMFAQKGEFSAALDMFTDAKKIAEDNQDLGLLASACNNLATINSELKNYDVGIVYFYKALEINRSTGDVYEESINLQSLALLKQNQGSLDSAKICYAQALEISLDLKDEKGEGLALFGLGQCARLASNNGEAISYFEKAFKIGQENKDWKVLNNASEELYQYYQNVNDNSKAFYYYQEFISSRDSINNVDNLKALLKQEYRYNLDKKVKYDSVAHLTEIKEKELLYKVKVSENESQEKIILATKKTNIILYLGLAIISMLVLYLINRYRLIKAQQRVISSSNKQLNSKVIEVEKQKEVALAANEKIESQKLILEVKNKESMESLFYAKQLQESVMSPQRLVKEWLTDSFLFFKPKGIISGDFFWIETQRVEIENTKQTFIYFAVADCSGQDLSAAIVSVLCTNALNRAVKEFGLSAPAQILDKTSELLNEAFVQKESNIINKVDIALCSIDLVSKSLQYAGANNPLYLIKEGDNKEIIELNPTKKAVGETVEVDDVGFYNHKLTLSPGDTVYLFSNGFVDQFGGPNGKKYKYAEFKKYLLSIAGNNLPEQKNLLSKEFEIWKNDYEQIDDVCIIGVRVNGKERNNLTARELEVLGHLKDGLSSKLIADKMDISKNTVDTYRRRLLAKTNTYNATELINYCVDKEIL